MGQRFCPKCGATIKEGVFCQNCQEEELQQRFKSPLIQVSEYNRTYHKGSWHPFGDLEDLIIQRVREVTNKDADVKVKPFEFHARAKEKKEITVQVSFEGKSFPLSVILSYRQCDVGQKKKTGYYEGILQLRNLQEAVFDFIDKELERVKRRGVFITKTVQTKRGVDLYFTEKSQMHLIAQKLHRRFGGSLSANPQLFSRNKQTSKDIYRLNIVLEFPEFKPGDVVSFFAHGTRNASTTAKVAKIMRLGKLIHARDVLTGKAFAFEAKYTEELSRCDTHKTKVLSNLPKLSIMNPLTFQEEQVVNTQSLRRSYHPDEEVRVLCSDVGWCIIE